MSENTRIKPFNGLAIRSIESRAGGVARKRLELLLSAGGDGRAVLEEAGVTKSLETFLAGDTQDISPAQLRHVSGRAVSMLAAYANRMDGRSPLRHVDWLVILYCLVGAGTLRDAISRCAHAFEAIDGRCGRLALRETAQNAEIELDPLHKQRSLIGLMVDLGGIEQLHSLFGWLIAGPLPISQIMMDYDAPMIDGLGLPPLPFPVHGNAARTGFIFPASYLDYPVSRTGEELASRLPQSFIFDLSENQRQLPIAEQARQLASRMLQERQSLPSFKTICYRLGRSPATLRRHLARAGTSYGQIKESCRRELALHLLRRSDLGIEEISRRLGYCDSDAFRGAFRKWLGISPSKYRRDVGTETQAWL